jgi:hypothetical protein
MTHRASRFGIRERVHFGKDSSVLAHPVAVAPPNPRRTEPSASGNPGAEILSAATRIHLVLPFAGQRRKRADRAAVFAVVRQHAALCDRAKTVYILSGKAFVVGIQSKIGIRLCVRANPVESLDPGVPRLFPRQFQVAGSGKEL